MTTTYTFHADPGHGWLEVPYDHLIAAGLAPCDFSRYSYLGATAIYLEEDCDLAKYAEIYSMGGIHRFETVVRHHGDDCFVRELARNIEETAS